jgi:hypothetical protein
MDPIELNNKQIKCLPKNKKFISIILTYSSQVIKIKLNNIFIPFGVEKFNNKHILNLEFDKNINTHNNYISVLSSLENKINNKTYDTEINVESILVNKKFTTSLKESILGHILRTHITDSTEIFILKKDLSKMPIDKENLKGSNVNIELTLKGMWVNDEKYGIYWNINNIQIIKFN